MFGVPHVDTASGVEAMRCDQAAGEADLDGGAVDSSADLDLVPQRFRWHRVAVRVDRHERQDVVHPALRDVVGVEALTWQGAEEVALDSEPVDR